MANYPDWVLKHKKKGTYINKVGDKYYLYAAHSERIKGTKKVRRVSDGYIGRITKEDGLIPSKSKQIKSPASFELGLSYVIIFSTEDILVGLQRTFPKNGTLLYICAILNSIYGYYSQEFFEHCYLHLIFSSLEIPDSLSQNHQTAIVRGGRMIQDKLLARFGDDWPLLQAHLKNVHLLLIENHYYCCGLSQTALTLSNTYHISWRNDLWQK